MAAKSRAWSVVFRGDEVHGANDELVEGQVRPKFNGETALLAGEDPYLGERQLHDGLPTRKIQPRSAAKALRIAAVRLSRLRLMAANSIANCPGSWPGDSPTKSPRDSHSATLTATMPTNCLPGGKKSLDHAHTSAGEMDVLSNTVSNRLSEGGRKTWDVKRSPWTWAGWTSLSSNVSGLMPRSGRFWGSGQSVGPSPGRHPGLRRIQQRPGVPYLGVPG